MSAAIVNRPGLAEDGAVATCLIVAIRTAKCPARYDASLCDQEMNEEIEFAAYTARRVVMLLMTADATYVRLGEGKDHSAVFGAERSRELNSTTLQSPHSTDYSI